MHLLSSTGGGQFVNLQILRNDYIRIISSRHELQGHTGAPSNSLQIVIRDVFAKNPA